ncbi:FkbM family methyltransferase [Solirubrobacter taibaiensis]|nr:FkbM family methyltransferase [Solirubrobacter taibaiensis]
MGEFVLRESKAGGAARVAAELRRARALSRLGAGPADRARLFAASFYLLVRAQTARRGHDRLSVTIRAFGRQGRVTLSDYSQLLLLEAIFIDGDYDVTLATPPRTIVDLGSNIGVSILYFKLRFPDAHVIGVEPDPVAFELLRRNTAPLEHVRIRHAAVGAAEGSATFWSAPGAVASSLHRTHDAQQPVEVDVYRLQTLVQDVPTIDLLKLVVEGSEFAALESIDDPDRIGAVTGEIVLTEGDDERLRAVLAGFDVDLFEDKGDGFWQFHAVRRGTA